MNQGRVTGLAVRRQLDPFVFFRVLFRSHCVFGSAQIKLLDGFYGGNYKALRSPMCACVVRLFVCFSMI